MHGADDFVAKPYTPDEIFQALEQAQAWKRQIGEPRVEGEAMLDGRDQGETLRRLAGLRNMLLARGGMSPETVEEINQAIKAIWASVDQWGQRGKLEQVASLRYVLTNESLALTVLDEGGWLESRSSVRPDPLAGLVPGGLFDQMIADQESRSLKLVKRLRPT